jgi:hypothetical protein
VLLCSIGTTDCRNITEGPDQTELPLCVSNTDGGSRETYRALRIDEDDRSVVLAYLHPASPDGLSAPFHYIRSRILQRRSPPYLAESVLLN